MKGQGRPGRWLTTATMSNTPTGKIEWEGIPLRGYSAMVDGKVIGVIRYYPAHRHWRGTLNGWVWYVTATMGASRFGLKESRIRHFKSRMEAQITMEAVWRIPRHQSPEPDTEE